MMTDNSIRNKSDYDEYPVPGEDFNYKSRIVKTKSKHKKSKKSKKKHKEQILSDSDDDFSDELSSESSEESIEEKEKVVNVPEISGRKTAKFATNNIYLNPGSEIIQYNLNDFTNEEKEKLRLQLFARYEKKMNDYPQFGLKDLDPNINLNLLIARCEAIEDIINVSNKMDKISVFITIGYALTEVVLTKILNINAKGVFLSCMSMIKQFEPVIREFADAPIFNVGSDWHPVVKLAVYNSLTVIGIIILNKIVDKWLPAFADKVREYVNRFLEGGFAAFPELNLLNGGGEKRRPTEVPVSNPTEPTNYSGGVSNFINTVGGFLGLGTEAPKSRARREESAARGRTEEPPRRASRNVRFTE